MEIVNKENYQMAPSAQGFLLTKSHPPSNSVALAAWHNLIWDDFIIYYKQIQSFIRLQ